MVATPQPNKGEGGQGNVYICLHGGRGGLVKSLRSFLNPIFSKNYTFAKVDWIIFLYILARDPFKSSYTKKLKVKKNFLACDHFFCQIRQKI